MVAGTRQHNPSIPASQLPRAAADESPRPLAATGLTYRVAASLDEVIAAWQLVHRAYVRSGLIKPNPSQLHTLPRVVGPQTMVALGSIRSIITSSLSAYADSPAGLPLDDAYPDELDELRNQGRKIAEIGLLADRRSEQKRSINSLFDLMRFGVLYAIYHECDDVLIGVHPRHAPFYDRLIGFKIAGAEKNYATVNDNPVVLMRLNLRTTPFEARLPRGLQYFLDNPIAPEDFDGRYSFPPEAVRQSAIGRFLAWKGQAVDQATQPQRPAPPPEDPRHHAA